MSHFWPATRCDFVKNCLNKMHNKDLVIFVQYRAKIQIFLIFQKMNLTSKKCKKPEVPDFFLLPDEDLTKYPNQRYFIIKF